MLETYAVKSIVYAEQWFVDNVKDEIYILFITLLWRGVTTLVNSRAALTKGDYKLQDALRSDVGSKPSVIVDKRSWQWVVDTIVVVARCQLNIRWVRTMVVCLAFVFRQCSRFVFLPCFMRFKYYAVIL